MRLLTIKQAAEMLQVGETVLRNRYLPMLGASDINMGLGKYRSIRIPEENVIRFIRERTIQPVEERRTTRAFKIERRRAG